MAEGEIQGYGIAVWRTKHIIGHEQFGRVEGREEIGGCFAEDIDTLAFWFWTERKRRTGWSERKGTYRREDTFSINSKSMTPKETGRECAVT